MPMSSYEIVRCAIEFERPETSTAINSPCYGATPRERG